MLTLSKVAVSVAAVVPLVTARPTRSGSVMLTVTFDPTWFQLVPLADF
ncbi:MAG: hypothetical protein ACYC7E_01030 [Armatimonadota bacterium]